MCNEILSDVLRSRFPDNIVMTCGKFSCNPLSNVKCLFIRRIVSCKVAAHEQKTTTVASDCKPFHTPVHVF